MSIDYFERRLASGCIYQPMKRMLVVNWPATVMAHVKWNHQELQIVNCIRNHADKYTTSLQLWYGEREGYVERNAKKQTK